MPAEMQENAAECNVHWHPRKYQITVNGQFILNPHTEKPIHSKYSSNYKTPVCFFHRFHLLVHFLFILLFISFSTWIPAND